MQVRLLVVRTSESPRLLDLDAQSVDAARKIASDAGWFVLSVQASHTSHPFSFTKNTAALDHQLLCGQLATLLRAGLGAVEAIRALRDNARSDTGRESLDAVLAELEKGKTLGSAFSLQPSTFPTLMSAMVRSAERTSNLPDALTRYGRYASQMESLREKIRSAAIYPVFLSTLGTAVVLFLLLYVVPRFSTVYESVRTDLPWAAELLLAWGRLVEGHSTPVWGVLIAACIVAVAGMRSAAVRSTVTARLKMLPGVREFVREVSIARLYRTLAMLLESGLSLRAALTNSVDIFPGDARSSIQSSIEGISKGLSPSTALEQAGLTTPLTRSLIASGERSGQLAKMLDEAAQFLETDQARTLERVMRVVEPALMTAIGLAVGVIVVLMYLPIFELAGSLR